LNDTDIFIIVDPDTPDETTNPQYLADDEIKALEQWVRDGGRGRRAKK
jgi:unsaturated rhamnogalacturonyl hydrolase